MCCRDVQLCNQFFPSSGLHSICSMAVIPNHPETFRLKTWDVRLCWWDRGRMFPGIMESHIVLPYGTGPLGTAWTVNWNIPAWVWGWGLAGSCVGKLHELLTSRISMIDFEGFLILLENNLTRWGWQQTEAAWFILTVNGRIIQDMSCDMWQELGRCFKGGVTTRTWIICWSFHIPFNFACKTYLP